MAPYLRRARHQRLQEMRRRQDIPARMSSISEAMLHRVPVRKIAVPDQRLHLHTEASDRSEDTSEQKQTRKRPISRLRRTRTNTSVAPKAGQTQSLGQQVQ